MCMWYIQDKKAAGFYFFWFPDACDKIKGLSAAYHK